MYWYYTKSQKGSEKECIITAIPFICDSIYNILFGNLGECIRHTSTTTYYNRKKNVIIIIILELFVILLSYKYFI